MADSDEYEEVDVDEDGVRPVWTTRPGSASAASSEDVNGLASRQHPQAVIASILKGDKSTPVQRSQSVRGPPPGPIPKSPVRSAEFPPNLPPPNLPPPNAKKVKPPAPPPTYLKTRSSTVDAIPKIPPKPGSQFRKVVKPRLEDSFDIEKEEYTPEEFVNKYSERFPLHVRVSKGFYGTSETTSVSEGDTFNIHFVKKTKVVDIEDGVSNSFKVALNSAIQFGILFDPNNKREEALRGHMFNKVSDLLPLKTLPKVLRASTGWCSGSAESTVENHEQFIVKGWKRKLQKKLLKVYNPSTKVKKELPENCECKFSTAPYDNRLYLSDIVDHANQPFPCSAVLYVSVDSVKNTFLPSYLSSSVVNLKGTSINTTMVASGSCARMYAEYKKDATVEIPYDLDIEFQVMYPKEQKDTDHLYQTTRELLENIGTTKKSGYVLCHFDREEKSEAQSALYNIIREGNEMTGVDIVKPPAIYANVTLPASSVPAPVARSTSINKSPKRKMIKSEFLYDDIDSASSAEVKALEERTAKLETSLSGMEAKMTSLSSTEDTITKLSRDVTSAKADLIRADGRAKKAMEDVGKARSEIEELRSQVEQLKETCATLQNKVSSIRQAPPSFSLPPTPTTPMSPLHEAQRTLTPMSSPAAGAESTYSTIDETTCEGNREFLATLDFVQVLNVLEAMGLKKHHESFMEERVNGEILLECDDDVLLEELKITSKIQRSRIMKLIQGKYSAKKILQGEDPYVYARPK